jgi:hypothetical protein
MQTDYLLARGHTGQRGIAFIPHIGITYSAESGYRMFNGITFFAGYGSFWNFDGENWSGRLTFGIRSFLTDIPH